MRLPLPLRPPPRPRLPIPFRHHAFRLVWLGMGVSYAGDRFQQLAQAWLVATLTGSALGVGLISASSSLPLLLLPLAGVIVERLDRRRLLIAGQLVGAAATTTVAALVVLDHVAVWHIYAWALVNGALHLVSRPAYKVVLTQVVPRDAVRSAVSINSITESSSRVAMNAVGALLVAAAGMPIAFVVNALSYLAAAFSLWLVPAAAGPHAARSAAPGSAPAARGLHPRSILADLLDGLRFLASAPALLHPLLLTFATTTITGSVTGVLAAIVHAGGGSIVDLGLISAAVSVGSLLGSAYAGARGDGAEGSLRDRATLRYALFGAAAAIALGIFTLWPTRAVALATLPLVGFILFAEAVWNSARVAAQAGAAYQARLQSLTTMAFTLGIALGAVWAGATVDRFGLTALTYGAAALALLCLAVTARTLRRPTPATQ